ncbi:hypothetical protein [Leeuwenhoekiella sp. MAR_2009_132]|uniref:hypothetical protein n=1 Tax=Leeuwenhoekiella sp. MAR_2009_132 TaxID=1392489 RepID=UPI00048FCC98|nr:hypothetical protein [Leeuwenhoekiella sp. MAR_2009_132]
MYLSNQNHYHKTLNDLLERYTCTEAELDKIALLNTATILSLSYTDNGGFKKCDGEFTDLESSETFKLRVYYFDVKASKSRMMLLLPNTSNYNLNINLATLRSKY